MAHKLLLADDSVTIQRVIELTFADEDILVTTVGDGQQAIDHIKRDRPDIVLADASMPERDGFEVSAFVKRDPDLRHIPVLLLTGAFEPIDEERVRLAGCDGVLAKPFEPQLLIARVRELLSAAKGGRREPARAPITPPLVPPAPEPRQAPGARTPADLRIPADVRLAAEKIYGAAARDAQAELRPAHSASPTPLEPEDVGHDQPRAGVTPRVPMDLGRTAEIVPPPVEAADIMRCEPEPNSSPDADEMALPSLAPAQEPGAPLSLDEYLDQLDAAFATMTPPPEPKTAPPSRSPGSPWAEGQADTDWIQQIVRDRVDEPAPPMADTEPSVPPAPAAATPAASLATAFSAMLSVEQGEEVAPETLATVGVSPIPVDALVDEVTRRVAERLADRALRQQVADIVSAVAERLVREEIQRLKAKT